MLSSLDRNLIDAVKVEKSYSAAAKALKRGASPDASLGKSGLNRTVLHYAVSNGDRDMVLLLLEKGADPNRIDDEDMGPLHYAISEGRFDLAGLLLTFKADINLQDQASSRLKPAPLHSAVYADNLEKGFKRVEYLIARGADLTRRNAQGHTPESLSRNIGSDILCGYFGRVREGLDIAAERERALKKKLMTEAVENGVPAMRPLMKIKVNPRRPS